MKTYTYLFLLLLTGNYTTLLTSNKGPSKKMHLVTVSRKDALTLSKTGGSGNKKYSTADGNVNQLEKEVELKKFKEAAEKRRNQKNDRAIAASAHISNNNINDISAALAALGLNPNDLKQKPGKIK